MCAHSDRVGPSSLFPIKSGKVKDSAGDVEEATEWMVTGGEKDSYKL